MNSAMYQVSFVLLIFVAAFVLCFTHSITVGVIFLLSVNMVLPILISSFLRILKSFELSRSVIPTPPA